jgi:hypothetical protein
MNVQVVSHFVYLVSQDIQNLYDDPYGFGETDEIQGHHKLLEDTCKELDIDMSKIVSREASTFEIDRMKVIMSK